LGQFTQKGGVIERERIRNFVTDRELGTPQHAGLPQRQHGATQGFFVILLFHQA
jgi:hypothetical protein